MGDERNEEDRVEAALAQQEAGPGAWLETIYRENAGIVMQAAYRVTGSSQDAEDVLQTVFTRLARRSDKPDFAASPKAYLHRAGTNAALDIVQSRRARSGVSLEETPEITHRDPAPEPERRQLGRELHDQLREALTRVNRRGAEIFVLRYFEGLDNTEIAEYFGTTANTIAVTLHRVRERIKEDMAPLIGGLS